MFMIKCFSIGLISALLGCQVSMAQIGGTYSTHDGQELTLSYAQDRYTLSIGDVSQSSADSATEQFSYCLYFDAFILAVPIVLADVAQPKCRGASVTVSNLVSAAARTEELIYRVEVLTGKWVEYDGGAKLKSLRPGTKNLIYFTELLGVIAIEVDNVCFLSNSRGPSGFSCDEAVMDRR